MLFLFALVALPIACQEKMRAEKRAEEMAKATESAKAAASASASAPDPKEQQYANARKAVLERAKAHMAALSKLYQGVSEEERKKFADFFGPEKEAQAEADTLSKEAVFAGKQGMAIRKWDITGDQLDPQVTLATVDVFVQESQRGKDRCTLYKLDWKQFGSEWKRVARRDFRIIDCSL